jgi:hypothetical protein
VGQSMTVPACDSSHIMCWPQTGQAYLNSLMLRRKTFHIRVTSATHFLFSFVIKFTRRAGKAPNYNIQAPLHGRFRCKNLWAPAVFYGFNGAG